MRAAVDCEHEGVVAHDEGAAAGEDLAVPLVAVASDDFVDGVLLDGEVEGNGAVATVGSGEGVGYVLGDVETSVLVPVEAVVGGGHGVAHDALLDS